MRSRCGKAGRSTGIYTQRDRSAGHRFSWRWAASGRNAPSVAPLCLTASISTVLAHPLLLLIVGAAVSSYLVPSLTRSWQDHQKELEVKVSLVDQISKTVAEFIIAVQLAAFRSDIQTQEEFDEAYKDWEVAKPTIIGRLRAYFPNSPLLDEWKELALGVTDLY